MTDRIKIGIIICDRYRMCAGGKCLRSLRNRDGAFSIYRDQEIDLVGYATCGDCPGGNIEYAPGEMLGNGVDVIHLATGLIVGYLPCPRLAYWPEFIHEKHGVKVAYGAHPIPQKHYETHMELGTWDSLKWQEIIQPTLADERTRLAYN